MRTITLIPSHNEARNIESCLNGVWAQTAPTDILVVCDNCTDNTVDIVKSIGAEVFETVENKHKKAGALNQALDRVINNYDFIVVQDADTVIDPKMVSLALNEMGKDPKLGAICSKAGVKDVVPATWFEEILWRMQRIEYGQYDSSRIETIGAIKVIHGMAAVYRTKALLDVKKKWGRIYDEHNLTEDFELTICLKEIGWKTSACLEMRAWTSVPLNIWDLWTQRVRWFRGGVDVLGTHGWNNITAWEFVNHGLFIIMAIINFAVIYSLVTGGVANLHPLFFVVMSVMILDSLYRLRYVESLHLKEVLLCVSIVPFGLYLLFYQVQQIWAYGLSLMKSNQGW